MFLICSFYRQFYTFFRKYVLEFFHVILIKHFNEYLTLLIVFGGLLESISIQNNEMLAANFSIFNMDVTGFKLNNLLGHVLLKRGSKAVTTVTSIEKKRDNNCYNLLQCWRYFLTNCLYHAAKKYKRWIGEWNVPFNQIMSEKSALITSGVFLEWLKTHLLSPARKVALLLNSL